MSSYARDLDLNLLRVFLVVAETGSVTAAAARLYLTQPAVSAALKRLSSAIDAPLFARQGRRLVLTARGERLQLEARPHLLALMDAALAPPSFDPLASDRVIRLGLSDTNERLFLPALVRALQRDAPGMRLVVHEVQFRTVGSAFGAGSIDLAITVADALPRGIARVPLFTGSFVALFDPRHATLGRRPSLARYLAQRHLIVSYNGDLRGVVEDALGLERNVCVSVGSFRSVGALAVGTDLVATVPQLVAQQIQKEEPRLKTAPLPFTLEGTPVELLYREAQHDDPALAYVRAQLEKTARALAHRR